MCTQDTKFLGYSWKLSIDFSLVLYLKKNKWHKYAYSFSSSGIPSVFYSEKASEERPETESIITDRHRVYLSLNCNKNILTKYKLLLK